ncbi:STAS domain-containing protein [Paraconexibacter antarcticus]|uniref:Anti-sigma factor antagonist n=1 Tax=Paraconexibacter antarcticus TaxID=2949664 RepID=A0ABY5DQ10_9ACTN|nr:STAS domain-containing protein [Paraconexibacter antarcticus]UTI63313.1 STAS domain-containing protein [Paraconexibacter antarcticus]
MTTAGGPELSIRVVTATGPLDIAGGPRLKSSLAQDPTEADTHLIVDLREVEFADSTGLSILLNAARRRVAGGRHFVVVCRSGPVLRLLELTALTQTLRVVGSVEEARKLIQQAVGGPYRPADGD